MRASDLWTRKEKNIIDKYGTTETVGQLRLRLPTKSERAIQSMRNSRGIIVSKTLRSQIGKNAQSRVNHDKRLKIGFDLTWGDLPNHVQQVFLGGMLGDGGIYIKRDYGRYHYYAETHGKIRRIIWSGRERYFQPNSGEGGAT
jgi:hypothetical protein